MDDTMKSGLPGDMLVTEKCQTLFYLKKENFVYRLKKKANFVFLDSKRTNLATLASSSL